MNWLGPLIEFVKEKFPLASNVPVIFVVQEPRGAETSAELSTA
jgi:hypothetical protein